MNDVIFEDGLSRDNILNDVNGQGRFKWILDVTCKNLVVGLYNNDLLIKDGYWEKGILY